jgi:hypothetical protein
VNLETCWSWFDPVAANSHKIISILGIHCGLGTVFNCTVAPSLALISIEHLGTCNCFLATRIQLWVYRNSY